jgi:hypothetical protein
VESAELAKILTDPTAILAAILSAKGGLWATCGGMIDQLRSALRIKSLQAFAVHVEEEVKRLENRINVEGYQSNEFYEMFVLTAKAVADTTRDEKIQVLAKLLANQFLKLGDAEKLSYEESQHFVRCIDALSVEAIELLGVLTRVVTGNQTSMTQSHAALVSGVATSRQLYRTIPQMNPDLVLGLVSQLQAWNLAYIAPAPIREVDHQGIVQNDNIHLQALGTKLVRFVRDRSSAHSGK